MEKMKKIVSALLVCITLFSVGAVEATTTQYGHSVTMYAPDGRTASVHVADVETWKSVGWYDYPVTTVYAMDGRTAVISVAAVNDWVSVGWRTTNYITMYAADGRTANVTLPDIAAWKNVGWYEYPVTVMYAPDGRTEIVALSDVTAWENVGWIDGRKTTTVYAPDGRTATVPLWQLQQYLNVGWYDYPVYSANSSYYPGTSLPRYDFVVSGTYIFHESDFSEDGYYVTTYCYQSDFTSKNNYIDYLESIGWEYFDSEVEDGSSTWVLTYGDTLVLVTYYYSSAEVYITFA